MSSVYSVIQPDTLILHSLLTLNVIRSSRNHHSYPVAKLLILILYRILIAVFMSLFMMHHTNFLMKQLHTVYHVLALLNFIAVLLCKIIRVFTVEIAPFVLVASPSTSLHLCVSESSSFVLSILVSPLPVVNVIASNVKLRNFITLSVSTAMVSVTLVKTVLMNYV